MPSQISSSKSSPRACASPIKGLNSLTARATKCTDFAEALAESKT